MATLIAQRSSYWVNTNTNYPTNYDYRAWFNIYYEQNEEDKLNNRSQVIIQYCRQVNAPQSSGENYAEWPATYIDCSINGVSLGALYVPAGVGVGQYVETLTTKSTYVYHDDNGNASFSFYGSGWGKGTGLSTYGLPQINVSTKISNNTNENSRIDFGKLVTFNLTRPNTNVTEEIKYTINEVEYSIPITSNGEQEQEITYTFPTSLIKLYPNTDKPYIQVNLTSSNGTKSSTNVYLFVPDTYKPTISGLTISDVLENKPSALNGLWIKNKSLLKCVINATAQESASITSYSSSISDFSQLYNTNPFTTQALSIAGQRTITTNVTDSRGKTSTSTKTFNVIDYNTPSIEGKVERCLSDGTLNENGTYGKITVKYKVYPLNNGTSNLNSFTIKMTNGQTYTLNNGNYEDTITQVINLALSSSKSYKFTFEIVDIFGEPIIVEYILGVANKTISLRKGGKGVTIGKIATADGFNIYMGTSLGQNYDSSIGGLLQAKGKQIIDDEGNIVSGGDSLPIGTMLPIGTTDTNNIPTNWLVCDGREVSRTAYEELFNVIGTNYGAGDGSTTFNLPDKRGRVSVGLDSTQDEFNTIGKKGGNKINQELNCGDSYYSLYTGTGGYKDRTIVRATGLSATHSEINAEVSNLQPYEVDNWIIKALGSSISLVEETATVSNEYADSVNKVYSCDYINNLEFKDKYVVDEVIVGTYVDGKSIYRAYINGVVPSGPLLRNIDTIVNHGLWVYSIYGHWWELGTSGGQAGAGYDTGFFLANNECNLALGSYYSVGSSGVRGWIEYTKASDTATIEVNAIGTMSLDVN